MSNSDRRSFLREGVFGLATLGAATLTLQASAEPTESSGEAKPVPFEGLEIPPPQPPSDFKPTEDNILGPFFRKSAPFRAKITPPLEPGDTLVIRGRVWGHDSKQPLPGAVLHIWQANASGRYDNDDPSRPPKPGVFLNRARLVTDETGYYEYETIKPAPYQIGPDRWRPSHIHYIATAAGYQSLTTQLYFRGDAHQDTDAFIRPSLIIELEPQAASGGTFQLGTFDIVLAKA